jgi:salicylate hydroxylase
MNVAVVGGGIAGLTAAAALTRAGVACTVFEQASRLGDAGAGIQLAPNATRLLRRLGARLADVAVRPEAVELRRWDSGELIARTELGAACEASYGAPYYTLHRADLHRALAGLVDTVSLGRRCLAVTEHTDLVELGLADGSTAADVVVGADGVHSMVRSTLDTRMARPSGLTVHRGLFTSDRLPWLRDRPAVRIWLGPGRHVVCYPVSGGAHISVTAVTRSDGGYAGWHDEVQQVLAAAGRLRTWTLDDRPPLPRWHTRRVAVVGDAAHPMPPLGAQGANQAVEDAVVLAACLRTGTDVAAALRRYERLRKPRVARVVAWVRANARDHHLADGAEQRRRDAAAPQRRGLDRHEWLYGYDAEREM